MRISKKKQPKSNISIAMLMDGETEKWYMQLLKQVENISVDVKPEIPKNKNIEEQYDKVIELLSKEYDYVVWMIDLDVVIKHSKDCAKGKETPLEEFIKYSKQLSKNKQVIIIVNNPCIEYWFLLHYQKTSKYYPQCNSVGATLKSYMPDYEKNEKYFKKKDNDMYTKLRPNLKTAIANAKQLGDFDAAEPTKAYCEMYKLFDLPPFSKILDKL